MLLMMVVAAAGLTGCGALPSPAAGERRPEPTGALRGGEPIAYINGEAVTAGDLRPPLMELAGGQVLSEVVLDRMIRDRLADQGLALTPELIEAERALLVEAVTPGAEMDSKDETALLLRELRHRRGLGESRFASLLRRNAGLRLLVRGEVEVTPQAIQQAYQLAYGPAYTARILVVPTAREANRLRDRLIAGEAAFADLAVEHSTDASSVQGGLLAPISPVDPAFPRIVRDALVQLDRAGESLSGALALDHGYALVRLERKTRPDPVELADVKQTLTHRVHRRAERVLMQQLARQLLAQAKVIILDPALDRSWQQQKEALLGK